MPKKLRIKKKKYVPKHSKGDTRRVENKNAILELLQSGVSFLEIQIAHNAHIDPKTREIQRVAQMTGVPIRRVMRNIINRQSETSSYESVVGIVAKRESKSLKQILEETKEKKNRTILILDGISYSHNIGAILRTAYATGVAAVVVPAHSGLEVNAEVTRISVGASELVPIVYMSTYAAIETLRDFHFNIYGIDAGGTKHYYNEKIYGDSAFLFGSESEGSSDELLKTCDSVLRIPMKGEIGSINVSVSVGIVLFEKMRQEK